MNYYLLLLAIFLIIGAALYLTGVVGSSEIFSLFLKLKTSNLQQEISNVYQRYLDFYWEDTINKYKKNEKIFASNYDNLLSKYNELMNSFVEATTRSFVFPEKVGYALIIISVLFIIVVLVAYCFEAYLRNTWVGKLIWGYNQNSINIEQSLNTLQKLAAELNDYNWDSIEIRIPLIKSLPIYSLPTVGFVNQDKLDKVFRDTLLYHRVIILVGDVKAKLYMFSQNLKMLHARLGYIVRSFESQMLVCRVFKYDEEIRKLKDYMCVLDRYIDQLDTRFENIESVRKVFCNVLTHKDFDVNIIDRIPLEDIVSEFGVNKMILS